MFWYKWKTNWISWSDELAEKATQLAMILNMYYFKLCITINRNTAKNSSGTDSNANSSANISCHYIIVTAVFSDTRV